MSVEWRIICLYEWISPLRESLGLLFWPSENFQMVQTYAYRTNHILCRSWGFQMEGNAPEFKISSDGGWATFGSTSFRVLGSLPTAQGRDSSSRTCLVATLKSFPVLKCYNPLHQLTTNSDMSAARDDHMYTLRTLNLTWWGGGGSCLDPKQPQWFPPTREVSRH